MEAARLHSVRSRPRSLSRIMSHWLQVWASVALRAHCVGRDAHMMPGTEIADKGISVWLDVMAQKWAVIHFLKGDFLSYGKKKTRCWRRNVPRIHFGRLGAQRDVFRASLLEHNNKFAVWMFHLNCLWYFRFKDLLKETRKWNVSINRTSRLMDKGGFASRQLGSEDTK